MLLKSRLRLALKPLRRNFAMDRSSAPVNRIKRTGPDSPPRSQKRNKAMSQTLDESTNINTTADEGIASPKVKCEPGERTFEEESSMENTRCDHSSFPAPCRGPTHEPPVGDNTTSDTTPNQRSFGGNSSDLAGVNPASSNDEHRSPNSDTSSDAYVPYSPHYFDDDESVCTPVTSFDDLNKELGRWSTPKEPLRPENPYKKGRILEIRKHSPCPPFGGNYPCCEGERQRATERELRGKTLVELCLDRPPVAGEGTADQGSETLEILEEIRCGDQSGAQIVVCRFSAGQEEVVAKIYDPLYYGYASRWWSDQPRDVTYEADHDYSREAVAYFELDNQLGGTVVPKYYGSWTFKLPLGLPDGEKTRDVRLVLMERIKGKSMSDLRPESFPETTRMEIVKSMVEADAQIKFAGVRHGDVSQRNVMVCLTEAGTVERVAMVDFNYAVVTRLDNWEETWPGEKREPKPDKPPNPVDRWFGGYLWGVAGEWLPESWNFTLRASQDWLFENYGESEDYLPPWRELHWDEEKTPQVWMGI